MAAQRLAPIAVGLLPGSPSGGVATLALSAAATWLAYGFIPDANRQVSKIKAFTSTITGILLTTDVTCDVYSDAGAGVPNASLESRSSITSALSTGTWGEWTGFTSASNVTAGTQYWLVFKNLNALPATNFPTFRYLANGTWPFWGVGQIGWSKQHSVNSGGAWGTIVSPSGGWRIEYADGTFQGVPVQNAATSSTNGVYSAREYGIRFTTPNNARWNVRGVALYNRSNTGTPTAGLRGRLYTGALGTPSLVATTPALTNLVPGAAWAPAWFSSAQIVEPGTSIIVAAGEAAQSDTSSNRYNTIEYTVENDANSKTLMTFAGTMQAAYFDGTNWTFTDTTLVPIGLLLDTDGEFAASAGVSGARIFGGF